MIFEERKLYIDGRPREAGDGTKFVEIDPWTGETAGYAPDASPKAMERTVKAAKRAFDTTDRVSNAKRRQKKIFGPAQVLIAFEGDEDAVRIAVRTTTGRPAWYFQQTLSGR